MKVSITGQQVKVGQALQQYVEDKLHEAVNKYFDHAISADVVFGKERHLFTTDVIVNEGTGSQIIIKSKGLADDAHASFDQANERIEKQLRRYKRKLKNHHKAPMNAIFPSAIETKKFVLSSKEEDHNKSQEQQAPLVIAEKPTSIERLAVNEAVIRMDMLNVPTLLFINRLTDTVSVIYRREDENITWIDSGIKVEKV